MLSKNMGGTDRLLRAVIGAGLLILAFAALAGTWAWIAGIVGLVLLATAAIGYCPLYAPFGIKTCRTGT
ncbi:DUF2892 domain-containing protein [Jannaschia sp. KMU-145]|uniref:YgaP family membrane protein n=1 Tax=Jannaschia halovivens TaxID=3388667 RepID=UPI00396B3970